MAASPNILMLSYFYPPAATGVRRIVSLVRHLPDHGWNPLVLSCRDASGAGYDPYPLDETAVAAVPVIRTESIDPYRLRERLRPTPQSTTQGSPAKSGATSRAIMELLRSTVLIPDDRAGWIPFAVREGARICRRHPIRAIYSSNYPQSSHVAAMLIRRRTGLPWLADFRDGWTQNPAFFKGRNPLVAAAQKRLEATVAREADRIVTVSPPITRHLQTLRRPEQPPAVTIFNGFEPAEWEHAVMPEPLEPGRLTMLYAGTFFGRRRPDKFFAALRILLRKRPKWREQLRVRMRCALSERELGLLSQWDLEEVVEVLPPVPHRDIVTEMRRADACLLILEEGPGADIMVSQKVFEYLAARRPLFAILPEGAAAEILHQTGGASVHPASQVKTLAVALHEFLGQIQRGHFELPPVSALRQFERPIQAAEIAALLTEMAS